MAGENPEFAAWVRTLRCLIGWHNGLPARDPCFGAVQAHHAGPRAMGRRAHDRSCISLCLKHHDAWHGATGVFKGWDKMRRRAWSQAQIEWTQKEWSRLNGEPD